MPSLSDNLFTWRNILVPLLLAVGLILLSRENYLLFHAFAEIFSIGVAWAMLAVMWHTYAYSKNHLLMYISIGFFWLGVLDLVHTLAYKGMGIFPGDDADFPIQLWVATRFPEALLLLSAPLFIQRPVSKVLLFWGMGVLTSIILLLVAQGLPTAYVEGQGLTSFKIYSEYVIVALLLLALGHFYLHRTELETGIFQALVLVLVFTAISELAFTFYVGLYGLSSLIGHLFKIFAFWVICTAIIKYPLQQMIGSALEEKRTAEQLGFQAQLLNSVRESIMATDLDGRVIYWGKGAEKLYGYRANEVQGQPGTFIVDALEEGAEQERLRQVYETGAWHGQHEQKRKDGSSFWAERFVFLVYDKDGTPAGLVGIVHDITPQRKTEQELRASESLLREMAANYPHSYVYVIEKDFTIGFAEGMAFKKHYLDPAQFVGLSLTQVFGPHASVIEVYYRKTFNGEATSVELFIDNQFLLYHNVPLLNGAGEVRRILSVIEDITERKQVEMERNAIADIGNLFRSPLELSNIYPRLMEILCKRLQYPMAMLELYDQAAAEMIVIAACGISFLPLPMRVPVAETISGTVAQTGKSIVENNARVRSKYHLQAFKTVETFVCVPIVFDKEVYGTLTLADIESRANSLSVAHTLLSIANQLAQEIARKQTEQELSKSNQLLQAVIRQAPFAAYILTGDFEHIQMLIENKESQRILGETLEARTDIDANKPESLACRFFSVDAEREIALAEMPGPRAFLGENVENEEFLFRHADGTEILGLWEFLGSFFSVKY